MDTKVWYQSKTMWGGIVAVLAGIAGVLGYSFGDAEQSLVVDGIIAAVGAVGGILAVFGRATATTELTAKKE